MVQLLSALLNALLTLLCGVVMLGVMAVGVSERPGFAGCFIGGVFFILMVFCVMSGGEERIMVTRRGGKPH